MNLDIEMTYFQIEIDNHNHVVQLILIYLKIDNERKSEMNLHRSTHIINVLMIQLIMIIQICIKVT